MFSYSHIHFPLSVHGPGRGALYPKHALLHHPVLAAANHGCHDDWSVVVTFGTLVGNWHWHGYGWDCIPSWDTVFCYFGFNNHGKITVNSSGTFDLPNNSNESMKEKHTNDLIMILLHSSFIRFFELISLIMPPISHNFRPKNYNYI